MAIVVRDQVLPVLARTERVRFTIGKTLDVASAGTVIGLGIPMLMG